MEIKKFIIESKNFSSKEIIYNYLEFCKDLMFQDQDLILDCIQILKENINKWAIEKSFVYRDFKNKIIEKKHLENKDIWYVQELMHESTRASTNGSTTGYPFSYLRWNPIYDKVEFENHYDLVLNEFDIPSEPEILYFFPQYYQTESDKFILRTSRSGNGVIDHGVIRNGFNHYVNFEKFKDSQEEFFVYLFEYAKEYEIDVIYTSGPRINQLCNYIKKYNIKHKIANLLSNTNERFLPADAYFLIQNNYFNHVCDHMRCWDGGVSFFTCKEKNYHLMDNLSWCEDVDTKIVSTDYFSLSSPFIRYWNGDYCKINNVYQRCDCGRLYRDFEFLENRPFSLKGLCLKDIKDAIQKMNIQEITQARCSVNSIDIISNRELSEEEKSMIQKITDKFNFKFLVE